MNNNKNKINKYCCRLLARLLFNTTVSAKNFHIGASLFTTFQNQSSIIQLGIKHCNNKDEDEWFAIQRYILGCAGSFNIILPYSGHPGWVSSIGPWIIPPYPSHLKALSAAFMMDLIVFLFAAPVMIECRTGVSNSF